MDPAARPVEAAELLEIGEKLAAALALRRLQNNASGGCSLLLVRLLEAALQAAPAPHPAASAAAAAPTPARTRSGAAATAHAGAAGGGRAAAPAATATEEAAEDVQERFFGRILDSSLWASYAN